MSQDSFDTKPRESVVVYGLSSEGYQIAAKLAARGYKVSLIDETLGTAMELRPEIAGDYRELRSLLADEVLLTIKSLKESVSSSKVIFFTPKIRRRNEEIPAEAKTRLGDVTKNMSSGTLFVYCLPCGISESKEIIDKIEHSSGLVSGKGFHFAYAPLDSGKPSVFGCDSKELPHSAVVDASGLSMEVTSIPKAELIHAQRVVAKYATFASSFETARRLTQAGLDSTREYKQIFCEDLSSSSYDLSLILDSLETGDPILYLASGANKSIESYGRFLVERVREFVKVKEIKAARLKIILFTDADILEMRGDKINLAYDLVERLRDYFSDIDYMNVMKEGFAPPTGPEKVNLMIFLSGSAEMRLYQLYEEQITMAKSHMIRANLPIDFVT
ncbi:MAG: hypothetical protein JRN20_08450 [Nitrososphaerota archaeon]|nr:hypothetical protein [Nitrososphaerota archaeon]